MSDNIKLIVLGLTWSVTETFLLDWLQQWRITVLSSTMRDGERGKYAFIHVPKEQQARAIGLSGKHIDCRPIAIKVAR